MELIVAIVIIFVIQWIVKNWSIFDEGIKKGISMSLPYVVFYFILLWFKVPMDIALLPTAVLVVGYMFFAN